MDETCSLCDSPPVTVTAIVEGECYCLCQRCMRLFMSSDDCFSLRTFVRHVLTGRKVGV